MVNASDASQSYKSCSTSGCGGDAVAAAASAAWAAQALPSSAAAYNVPGSAGAGASPDGMQGVACAPLMPGNTPSVGMESTVVFEGCWRRFQQRHGAVSGRRRVEGRRAAN